MAKVSIAPVEFLNLEFNDGITKRALFNNEALIYFTNEFGKFDFKEIKNRPYDYIAKLLYCGMKVCDKEVTLDEAMCIVAGGGEALTLEITRLLINNFVATADDENKKKLEKEIHKMLNTIQE